MNDMKTSPDDAAPRSSASRGPVDPGASTGPRTPAASLSYPELADRHRRTEAELAALTECVDKVIRLHVRPRHGRHRGGGMCTECGFPWPCATVRALRGEDL